MSSASSPARALDWQAARRLVLESVGDLSLTPRVEDVALLEAHGRVLAQDAAADRDYPTLRRSLRDGFAVRSADTPGTLRIRGEVRAGEEQAFTLEAGEAIEIMTGAPVPDDADSVVMVEHAERVTDSDGLARVKITSAAPAGQWINNRGAESTAGLVLVNAGTRLDAAHIASLAMSGCAQVSVFARPSVGILATGDEIVEISDTPARHQIRNSNSYMLAAMVAACGGTPFVLPVARDTVEALTPLLTEGLRHDMLLVTGGVSAGRYDLVKPALQGLGVNFVFEKVRIQPGGPCAFGTVNNKPVFGLPGNPGSTCVSFQLFAQPALAVLSGETQPILPTLMARFDAPFRHRPGLTRFLPARLSADGQHLTHIPWQGSSDVPALARANAFLVADGGRESWEPGDLIPVMRKL